MYTNSCKNSLGQKNINKAIISFFCNPNKKMSAYC